ncbi:Calcium channel yvc1 [Microbotryomycetes sp. JL201]|nr:Calcium channel yvc1 [Microbotryomycetes sp. JL201]
MTVLKMFCARTGYEGLLSLARRMDAALERAPLLRRGADSHTGHSIHPRTVTRIVERIKALTLELLPIQVNLDEITSPVSSILTKDVVEAYSLVGGDFDKCVPFALLEARRYFRRQAYLNPSDSDENEGRKLACEALARKLVAKTPMSEQYSLLSARYTVIDSDGDESLPLSALESAVDQHATFFLSSGEAQRCVFALWRGLLVQKIKDDGRIEYEPYKPAREQGGGFMAHFDPDRVAVPRYQFFFRIFLWVIFIVAYSIAIQTPDRGFGLEDVLLYVQVLGYVLEDVTKVWKIGIWSSLSFWLIVNCIIYAMLTIAFVYRVADMSTHNPDKSFQLRLRSFQWLSSASPLVWMKLVTVFDVFQYFGTLQIVTFRMLRESAVFFTLLALLAIGFGQALTGLDIADQTRDSTEQVVHSLIQGLLGSPTFESYEKGTESYPFSMVLYYGWSVLTLVILLNILVALFGSAYQECTDEAVPTFMAFFSGKTISAIRAPDQFVYVAPFNLIEIFILPLEFIVSTETYTRLNRFLMGTLFFIPLTFIALFETHFYSTRQQEFQALLEEPDEFTDAQEDPEAFTKDDEYGQGDDEGLQISTIKFEDLKKKLPDLSKSLQVDILAEVKRLHARMDKLEHATATATESSTKDAKQKSKK